MCGSATLAMVVSSTCISMPRMTPIVTRAWASGPSWWCWGLGAVAAAIDYCPSSPGGEGGWVAPLAMLPTRDPPARAIARVDADVGREAGDHRPAGIAVDRDPNRHPLPHLDPIAARILRRQNRELRAGAGTDAGDVANDVEAGIGVDLDPGALADIHVAEVGLLVIGLDIGGPAPDQGDDRHAGDRGGADLEPVGLADDSVGGGADLGPRKVEQRLLAGGSRGLDRRLVAGAAAAKRRLGGGRGGAGIGEPLAGLPGVVEGLVLARAGDPAASHQGFEPLIFALLVGEIGLSTLDVVDGAG